MKECERLLSLEGKRIEVWKASNGDVAVSYQGAEIKSNGFLISEFGIGSTFEDACKDYLSKISGKTLVFKAYSESREEVAVL